MLTTVADQILKYIIDVLVMMAGQTVELPKGCRAGCSSLVVWLVCHLKGCGAGCSSLVVWLVCHLKGCRAGCSSLVLWLVCHLKGCRAGCSSMVCHLGGGCVWQESQKANQLSLDQLYAMQEERDAQILTLQRANQVGTFTDRPAYGV